MTDEKYFQAVRKFLDKIPVRRLSKAVESALLYQYGWGKPSYILPIHSLGAVTLRWGKRIFLRRTSQQAVLHRQP